MMEEIIDVLRQAAVPQTFPLELPEEDELVEVEEIILIPLPKSLKIFLLTVSDLVCGTLEPVTVSDSQSHTYLPEVTAEAWAAGLPRDLIPICQKSESYYCIDQDGQIQLWEGGELAEPVWEDIWDWAQDIWITS